MELLDECRLSFCIQWQTRINPIVKHMVNVFGNYSLVADAVQFVFCYMSSSCNFYNYFISSMLLWTVLSAIKSIYLS